MKLQLATREMLMSEKPAVIDLVQQEPAIGVPIVDSDSDGYC